MKKVGIVIAILIALVLLLPAVFGMFTSNQVDHRVTEINEAGLLDIQITDYRRGWFSSTAALMISAPNDASTLPPGAAPGDPTEAVMAAVHALLAEPLAVRVTIAHGPLPRSRGLHFGTSAIHATTDADDARVAAHMAALDVPWLFDFHAVTSFGGTVHYNATLPPVNTNYAGAVIRFSGASSQGRVRGAHVNWDLQADELDVDIGLGRVEVAGLQLAGDNTLVSRHLIFGPADMSLERFSVTAPMLGPTAGFHLNRLQIHAAYTPDAQNRLLNSEGRMSFDTLSLGEDIAVAEGHLQMEVTNVQIAAWEQLLAESEQLAAGTAPEAVVITRLQPLLRDLLAESPALAITPVSFIVNDHSVRANLRVAIDGARVPDNLMTGFDDPMALLDLLDLEADASVAKVLIEELAANVARTQLLAAQDAGRPINEDEIDAMAAAQANLILMVLSAQGMITDAGDNYTTAMTIRNGTLTVNGTELPLSMLEAAIP